jgi:hypothetical protein
VSAAAITVISAIGLIVALCASTTAAELDAETGLRLEPGFDVVKVQCTVCHSARLVTQNRADREGWLQMIRWMQDSQGLWPLGENEAVILDYLAANYGPLKAGRRKPLQVTFD